MNYYLHHGVAIHYRFVGKPGNGRETIVFVNSLGTDFRIWDGIADLMSDRFNLLFHDKRGHGLSDVGDGPKTIQSHAADLLALIDHLGIDDFWYCGLSVGGLVGLALSQTHATRMKGAIFCDTAPKIGDAATWNARIDAVRERGMPDMVDEIFARWFTPETLARTDGYTAVYRNMLGLMSAEGYINTCAAIRDADFTKEAREFQPPAVCLVGDHDLATPPELVKTFSRTLPNAAFHIINDAGHLPCIEKTDDLAHHIASFIEEHS